MINTASLSPMQLGRLNAALDKRFNFSTAGVMTLGAFIRSHAGACSKRVGDHAHQYNRRKYNRMSAEDQRAYDARLARPDYQFRFGDGYAISIPKIVFDALDVPLT